MISLIILLEEHVELLFCYHSPMVCLVEVIDEFVDLLGIRMTFGMVAMGV